MLKKNSEVPTHPMHSRYGNINLICPKYKHELDGGDPSLSVQLGYGILSQRQFCEVKTESFLTNGLFLNPVMRTETILVSTVSCFYVHIILFLFHCYC